MDDEELRGRVKYVQDTLAGIVQKKFSEGNSPCEVRNLVDLYDYFCERFGCISEKDPEIKKDYVDCF